MFKFHVEIFRGNELIHEGLHDFQIAPMVGDDIVIREGAVLCMGNVRFRALASTNHKNYAGGLVATERVGASFPWLAE
jgi:hypothetical protein